MIIHTITENILLHLTKEYALIKLLNLLNWPYAKI
jgi:hypothetical protein